MKPLSASIKIKKNIPLNSIQKIAIRGIDPLGDMVIASAFFREVRRFFPKAYIRNLVSSYSADLMRHCPYVDDVVVHSYNDSWIRQLKVIQQLRKESFDLGICLSGNINAALVFALAGIPYRIGYATDHRKILLTTWLDQEIHDRYRGENHFDLLRAMDLNPTGVMKREIWLTDAERLKALDLIMQKGIFPQSQPLFAINPLSKDPRREWPPTYWCKLTDYIHHTLHGTIIVCVRPDELDKARFLTQGFNQPSAVPIVFVTEGLLTTAAILEHCTFAIATDSGFMHLALATHKPHVIGLFGLLPPISSFPIDDPHHTALIANEGGCIPCFRVAGHYCEHPYICMEDLTPNMVIDAIRNKQYGSDGWQSQRIDPTNLNKMVMRD